MSIADDESGTPECPFCSSTEDCPHLLLVVDRTFRGAEGGPLIDAFNDQWTRLTREGGGDFEERDPFENLLEVVDSLADASIEYNIEGGPGMSSNYIVYYVESKSKAQDAVARFMSVDHDKAQ
jgi:hypothetical protein